ncbi:MAG: sugar dehydrogenase complex small subunit [Hyphomicrobium sp.]
MAAAIAAVGVAGFPTKLYADADITVDQFIALSKKLTEKDDLDAALAGKLLGGFLAIGKGPDLAALIAGEHIDDDLANAIVAAWYSGLYDSGWGEEVLTFNHALVWQALTFAAPPGNCAGPMGYWADPPAS